MSNLEQVARFLLSVIRAYGLKTKEVGYQYPAGSMDNSLLRAIEGIHPYGGAGYVYIAGRNGDEYVSGNDRSLAVKYDGSRPNIPYLVAMRDNVAEKYFGNIMNVDRGGGYVQEQWVEPDEHGGVKTHDQLNYSLPIDDNMHIAALYKQDEELGSGVSTLGELAATLLGNYMVINHRAPDRSERYTRLINAIRQVIPSFQLGRQGQYKVPYYELYVSL